MSMAFALSIDSSGLNTGSLVSLSSVPRYITYCVSSLDHASMDGFSPFDKAFSESAMAVRLRAAAI